MKAVSKINLFLEVLGKRADGYHEIRTLFYPLDVPSDDVVVVLGDESGIAIESESPDVPPGEANICWRAAAKFAEGAGVEPCWTIKLKKGIPVAAGLGGGSSDAAAVLSILDAMHPGRCEIRRIAEMLGADVAYFLNPVPATGGGRGEILTPLRGGDVRIPVLLVNPLFPVSSAWAYKNWRGAENASKIDEMIDALASGDIAKIARNLRNDLAPALFVKFPLLSLLRESLLANGALNAAVSGSGPTIFGIFPERKNLADAASALQEEYGGALKVFA